MTFEERLNDSFSQFIKYRKSAGYATETYTCSVPPFIRYCYENHSDSERIDREMVDGWLSFRGYSNNSQAVFIAMLREYTKFLNFLGYSDYIPDEDFSLRRTAYNPYLFTDSELASLFDTIDSYTGSTCGKRYLPQMVLPVYTRFLFCCGMRPQEPPALRFEDVDLCTGDIYIRQSKRHKDRHILMSCVMLDLCRRYDSIVGKREWFFQTWKEEPYERKWYSQLWRRLLVRSGVSWRGTPRPYDLRHAFASRNIIRWIDEGMDVMELLPYLSAYMGHSELTSTLYYVHLLPENLRRSARIDWDLLSSVYGEEVISYED